MSIKAYKLTVAQIKSLCDFFDVDRSGASGKDDLIDRLLDFLGEPAADMTKTGQKAAKKKQKKKKTVVQDDDDDDDLDDDEPLIKEGAMPTDKQLRQWVRAYIRCFNMEDGSVKHAIGIASRKFGIDLKPKRDRIKELLTEEL